MIIGSVLGRMYHLLRIIIEPLPAFVPKGCFAPRLEKLMDSRRQDARIGACLRRRGDPLYLR